MVDNGNGVSSLPPLEVGIGLRCNDFVMLMADTRIYQQILTDSVERDKITPLGNGTLLMCLGGSGPLFSRIVSTGMSLHKLVSATQHSVQRTPRIIGQTMQDIRRQNNHGDPLDLHIMLGTADPTTGVTLYKGDPYGFMLEVPYAYIGINGFLTASLVDKYYKPDLTVQEAYSVLKQCVHHMKRRTVLSYPKFTVKVLDRTGTVNVLPDLKYSDFKV
ncbi:hypothetical protein M8J76_000513 [Diaphorina citri]|nr:hypothetical protein M8J75_015839 [Diaphorina citri]KAI5744247.1 hypothetical protein M8J76_000513 [Diaphorina citri]KAI5752907.1 hypothetical protein M8J77_021694 [Diaphorina citri]